MERIVGAGYHIDDGWLFPTSDHVEWLVPNGCPVLELPVNRRKVARRKIYDRYIFCPRTELFYIVYKSGGEFFC